MVQKYIFIATYKFNFTNDCNCTGRLVSYTQITNNWSIDFNKRLEQKHGGSQYSITHH